MSGGYGVEKDFEDVMTKIKRQIRWKTAGDGAIIAGLAAALGFMIADDALVHNQN